MKKINFLTRNISTSVSFERLIQSSTCDVKQFMDTIQNQAAEKSSDAVSLAARAKRFYDIAEEFFPLQILQIAQNFDKLHYSDNNIVAGFAGRLDDMILKPSPRRISLLLCLTASLRINHKDVVQSIVRFLPQILHLFVKEINSVVTALADLGYHDRHILDMLAYHSTLVHQRMGGPAFMNFCQSFSRHFYVGCEPFQKYITDLADDKTKLMEYEVVDLLHFLVACRRLEVTDSLILETVQSKLALAESMTPNDAAVLFTEILHFCDKQQLEYDFIDEKLLDIVTEHLINDTHLADSHFFPIFYYISKFNINDNIFNIFLSFINKIMNNNIKASHISMAIRAISLINFHRQLQNKDINNRYNEILDILLKYLLYKYRRLNLKRLRDLLQDLTYAKILNVESTNLDILLDKLNNRYIPSLPPVTPCSVSVTSLPVIQLVSESLYVDECTDPSSPPMVLGTRNRARQYLNSFNFYAPKKTIKNHNLWKNHEINETDQNKIGYLKDYSNVTAETLYSKYIIEKSSDWTVNYYYVAPKNSLI
eukprot:GHVL01002995.1.p1 GENE.GHVL01002995.1~~GHVL01002995.1.p1  ORF type:complete len:538 (+),score=129.83 GHVL01002995.1:39-1652(+)